MKKPKLILILILVIAVLAGLVIYLLAIRPAISGYAVNAYNQGYQDAILQIVRQAATCQQVPLYFGNQTINLVAVGCPQ